MQKKIPNLLKTLRADNVDKLKIIIENNANLKEYIGELPSIFDDTPKITAFIAYFGAMECFDYVVDLIKKNKAEKALQTNQDNTEKKKKMKLSITHADKSSRSTIHFAAAGGKSKFIRRLVEDFNQLSDLDAYNRSALHYAAEYNQKKAFDLLTSFSVLSIDSKDIFGNTPLHLATDNMCTVIVKSLVEEHSCNLNLRDKDGASPLMFAAKVGSLELFDFFLEKNANVKVKSKSGLSLLHYAAFGNDSDIIDKIVKDLDFSNIDAIDNYKRTPLFYACEKGAYYSAYSLVVDYKATLNTRDIDEATPFHFAATSGNVRIFTLLLNNGAKKEDFLTIDKFGRTILHYAAEAGSIDTIKFLLNYTGSDQNSSDDDQYLFRDQLKKGLNYAGYTALHCAAENNHPYIIEMLVNEFGFDINKTNQQRETPLLCAVKTNSIDSVVMLLKLGADTSIQDNESITALDFASQNNFMQIVRILQQNGATSSNVRQSKNNSTLETPEIASKPANVDNVASLEPL